MPAPILNGALCTCTQIVVCEVDGLSLQPSTWHLYTLLMPPNCRQRSVILVGMVISRASCVAREGTSGGNSDFIMAGVEASYVASWCSCGGGTEMVAVFLGGGGMEDLDECYMAPHKSPYKPSTSNPATANQILPNPSVSNYCASSFSLLACCSKLKTWKEREKCNLTCQT